MGDRSAKRDFFKVAVLLALLGGCSHDDPIRVSADASRGTPGSTSTTVAETSTTSSSTSPTTPATTTSTTGPVPCAPDGPFGPYVFSLSFAGRDRGWAGGSSTIRMTEDGGRTWTASCLPEDVSGFAWAVTMRGQRGWAAMRASDGVDFVRTTDGGHHWMRATTPPEATRVADIAFADDDHGWAVGTRPAPNGNDKAGSGGIVLGTGDGGRTWDLLEQFAPDVAGGLNRISFADASHGWAIGQTAGGAPVVLATSDGGATWRREELPGDAQELRDVDFVDPSKGRVLAQNGDVAVILATVDGGTTWSEEARTPDAGLWDLDFLDASHGWALGNDSAGGGLLLTTADGGAHWAASAVSGRSLTTVAFVDPDHGWAGGMQGACVYVTTDGGRNWEGRRTDAPGPCAG